MKNDQKKSLNLEAEINEANGGNEVNVGTTPNGNYSYPQAKHTPQFVYDRPEMLRLRADTKKSGSPPNGLLRTAVEDLTLKDCAKMDARVFLLASTN